MNDFFCSEFNLPTSTSFLLSEPIIPVQVPSGKRSPKTLSVGRLTEYVKFKAFFER